MGQAWTILWEGSEGVWQLPLFPFPSAHFPA